MAQQTFEELVAAVKQAESRDKRYKDDGKTLTTSPKGALGEMQVMPKTIRDPGFGVVPARDKSPDEIARVGVDYLQAMKQKYGDTEKALIAYNWGPGSTDKWLAAGADPKKLPAETRTYVERVKGFLGKDVPRETSVAKKEREPLPASLPPMAQADIKTPSVKPEAAARVASLGPGYQAALALSFLAETDDEEDRKTTITQEYLAKAQEEEDDRAATAAIAKRQANVFADLSNTTIRSPFAEPQQPVRMKDGGEVSEIEEEEANKPFIGNPNIRRQVGQARRNAAIQKANYRDEVAEAKDIARKGEAYQELEKYLQSRGEMPSIKVGRYLPDGTHGVFFSDKTNIGTGDIKINKNLPEMYMPSTIAHEVTHAADRQIKQQAMEQGLFGKSNQFTEAYEKMVGPEGRNRTQLLRKRSPEFEEDNRYYRSRPDEVAAHGIGAYSGPVMQDSAPRHVDATAATEFRILMDLAQRNVDKGPKGIEKIPAFFRKIVPYAEGGEVEQERLTMQQIERLAAQEAAEREAASTPAFIAQKSGIGRKAGPISQALQSGDAYIAAAKGVTEMPYNLAGAPMDIAMLTRQALTGQAPAGQVGTSEYIKKMATEMGIRPAPPTDPTLRGFYDVGDIGSSALNPASIPRAAARGASAVAQKAGDAARDFQLYNQQLAVPGASYIRRPAGGVFPTAKNVDEEPISSLDTAIKGYIGTLDLVRAPAENKEAAKQFIDTKLRDYFKTKAGSVSDPLREALISGRIKIPKDTPLEEQFPQALINASRAGDVTAMKEIEKRFDRMMNVSNFRVKQAGAGVDDREAAESFKQTILQQMKANPNVIPDEFLLRLAKKDTSKLSKQEQATEVAAIRQKLADNPTLFNTVIEPKMTRLIDDQLVENVSPSSITQYADLYPALANAPKRQEGIMALQADVPITDLTYMGIPDAFGMQRYEFAQEIMKMDPKDLAQMSVPEFYAKAIPSFAKAEAFKQTVNSVDKLAKAGKPVPANLGQFGTKEFLPTDSSGMTWREITDPKAALIQAKFLNNSIGGYAEAGTYGPLNKGLNALKDGETRLFSLYDKNGHAVNNVEFITPKIADDKLHGYKANTITQMNGNGVKTGNVVPENYADQMMDLVNALNPKDIPVTIKQLFQDRGLTPNPLPTQRATGGMMERQPDDNRRYL